jgi:hypothetical protein
MADRIYNEKEVARLLNRAAEMETERSVSDQSGFKNGLSLDELTQIAADSGIDPELVRKAAQEFDTSRSGKTTEKPATAVSRKEISCERWLEITPDRYVLDELITELNHIFNTSDKDMSWWDKLWDDYTGKAKVRKTGSSVEWTHTSEDGNFTYRVLLQRRGNRFRIRVSKNVHWGFEWYEKSDINLFALPSLLILTAAGAVLGNITMFNPIAGAVIGVVLFAALWPLTLKFNKSYVNKHRRMVADTTDTLAEQALLLMRERKSNQSEAKKVPIEWIEVDSEDRQSSQSSELKNKLRGS